MTLAERIPPLAVFTAAKSFDQSVIGNARLNRLGLHVLRVLSADVASLSRRALLGGRARSGPLADLERDGVVVVPSFLRESEFDRIRKEARQRLDHLARAVPRPTGTAPGFRPPVHFEGGFDRHDGSTLNRFVAIDREHMPGAYGFARSPRFASLCSRASTYRHRPEKLWLHEMTHGDAASVGDPQQNVHKDTFHSVIKLWLFLDDVEGERGFMYARGSHRMTPQRFRWEYRRSVLASEDAPHGRGGAFRPTVEELRDMGIPPLEAFPVPANTLVIADTRGFHCRGPGSPGARRLALHASLRPSPFVPVPY